MKRYIDVKEFTSFGSDVDLVAESPGGKSQAGKLVVIAVGATPSLVIKTCESGPDRTLSVAAGDVIECEINTIRSTSVNLTRVRVFWGSD